MFLVIGFTKRTSYSLVKYLLNHTEHQLIVSDISAGQEKKNLLETLDKKKGRVINKLGEQSESLLDSYAVTMVFLSPGVPQSIPLVQKALSLGIEVINDIEFFYRLFPKRTYIGITGTDGKTTVTTWLAHVLSQNFQVVLAGNMGTPIFNFHDKQYETDIFILELSSFQLESIKQFCPKIAVLINLHEDHMDRYEDIFSYLQSKINIFSQQGKDDLAILDKDFEYNDLIIKDLKSRLLTVSVQTEADFFYQSGSLYYGSMAFFAVKNLQVVGKHNIINAMFVAAMAMFLGVSWKNIQIGLSSFRGCPHRLEYLGSSNGVFFYNDSKATTPCSVLAAISSFENPVLLIAGGRSKGLAFEKIKEEILRQTKRVFLFGEMAEYLGEIWDQRLCYKTMEDAVIAAISYATDGDVVLLSPGGSSFDGYESFEDRGNHFKEIIWSILSDN